MSLRGLEQSASGAHLKDAPRSPLVQTIAARGVAAVILVALGTAAFVLYGGGDGAVPAFSVIFGALAGLVLQRSRFCFFCMFRDWLETGDPRGLLGLLTALAVGLIGTTLVFTLWLPDPSTGRLPPQAFIGPISFALVLAGLIFGLGMAISGSCVSAHLYRLGEGSATAPFALAGTVAGFVLGFLTWNTVYVSFVAGAPVVWLPARFGYAGALLGSLVALATLAAILARRLVPTSRPQTSFFEAVFVARWPAWAGGGVLGVIAAASYLRVAPLGVTAEIGARARQIGDYAGWLPRRLEGLDSLRGCIAVVRDAALTPNGLFVISLVLASFAAALTAGQFRPARPRWTQIARGLGGGVLLGWGAMTGLGCTIGTLFSGITAGALSGWVFGAAVFGGAAAGLYGERLLKRRSA